MSRARFIRKSDGSFSKCEIENWNNGRKFRPPIATRKSLSLEAEKHSREPPSIYNPVVISFHATSYRLSNLPCETIVRIEIRRRKRVHRLLPVFLLSVFKKKKSDDEGSFHRVTIEPISLA